MEVLYIDNWLQEGLAQAKLIFKEDWKGKYNSISPTRFFIPVPSSQKVVCGILYPGKDKSGREFPFIIFSITGIRFFDPFYIMPAVLEQNLYALDEILRKEETIYSLNTALKNYKASFPSKDSVNQGYRQYLSTSQLNEFRSRTGLSNLQEVFKDLTFQDNSVICISFAADDSQFSYDAGFLIHILQNKINISYKQSSVFWRIKTDGQYQILIFPFKLTAQNFTDLLSPDYNNERFISIGFTTKDSGYPEESNLTLGDFLKTL